MFEREIKFIYDFNLNKVNRLGPYFTFEQLLSSDIHPAILQYISAEIDYLIYEDRQKLLKNSLFDYSGEKISFHFNQISEEVKRSKRFAQEYIAKLILHASSFTINYLVRPKWTLTKFVFDEDNLKSTNDIKQILNYVYYYKYVNKILVSYINSKKILSMNSQEFEDLLNKADKLGVESYLPSILDNALKSMGEFFNIGEIQKSKIPLGAVEMFLEEKELLKHLQKVSENFGNDEGVKLNITDYQKVFRSVIEEKQELMPEPEEAAVRDAEIEEQIEDEEKYIEEEVKIDQPESEKITETEERKPEENPDDGQEELTFTEDLADNIESSEDEDETSSADDIEPTPEEEIIIAPPLKFRIKINVGSRIEPVSDMDDRNPEIREKDIPGEDSAECFEEELKDEVPEEESAEKGFLEEFNLAKMKFDEIGDEDKSFLQSLRDEGEPEIPETAELDDSGSESENGNVNEEELPESDERETKDQTGKKRSEWPLFIPGENGSVLDSDSDLEEGQQPGMELAEILEHKEMTKIIEVIFDYDIEDFANTLDEITNCKSEDDAFIVINETLKSRHIGRTSKEAEVFRSIISEYFKSK